MAAIWSPPDISANPSKPLCSGPHRPVIIFRIFRNCSWREVETGGLILLSQQRGDTRSSRSQGGMRWTRGSVRRALAVCGRRSRVVLAPQAGVRFATRHADDGVNKASGPRGERGISRNTTAPGMPDDSGASAVKTRAYNGVDIDLAVDALDLDAAHVAGAAGTRPQSSGKPSASRPISAALA